jgi:adenylate cyclase
LQWNYSVIEARSRSTDREPRLRRIFAVIYGNIGAADRLDFTVIGSAVNLVNRMETVAEPLDLPIVVSGEFARTYGDPLRMLGSHRFRGLATPHE